MGNLCECCGIRDKGPAGLLQYGSEGNDEHHLTPTTNQEQSVPGSVHAVKEPMHTKLAGEASVLPAGASSGTVACGDLQNRELLLANSDRNQLDKQSLSPSESSQSLSSVVEELSLEPFAQYYQLAPTLLGRGSFGSVRVCKSCLTHQEFAVKTMATQDSSQLELCTLRTMDHPNIVKIHGLYNDESSMVFMVMDRYMGDLTCAIRDVDGAFVDVAHVACQMITSIHYLHQRSIVHRDVKCSNYLRDREDVMDKRCKVVLTDFGSARTAGLDDRMCSRVGTEQYWSPQVYDCDYSSKADLWSIGVIMYILLKGFYPFTSESKARKMKVLVAPARNTHHSCVDLTRKLLAKAEEDRLCACKAMAHAFIAGEAAQAKKKFAPCVMLRGPMPREPRKLHGFGINTFCWV